MKTMKKVTALLLALMMVLSLAACGGKTDNGGNSDNNGSGGKDQPAAVDMTAQEVLDALKEKLGDSYGCDLAEDESRMTGYYELDMSKIDSWAAESSENSALDPSTAVVLKVKDGYAQDAAALLQTHDPLTVLLWLMAHTEDTNLYHRGGAEGAAFVKAQAAAILAAPPKQRTALTQALDDALIDRWLSPGGCADLLALALFLNNFFTAFHFFGK